MSRRRRFHHKYTRKRREFRENSSLFSSSRNRLLNNGYCETNKEILDWNEEKEREGEVDTQRRGREEYATSFSRLDGSHGKRRKRWKELL